MVIDTSTDFEITQRIKCRKVQNSLLETKNTLRKPHPAARELYRRGISLEQEHRLDEAAICLLNAATIAPRNASIRLKLGQILLSRGEFMAGWREFEMAYQLGLHTMPDLRILPWNGMRISQGHILLVGDQGFGDAIQFARYIPLVAARCDGVVLGCSEQLAPLLVGIKGVVQIVTRYKDIEGDCKVYCRLTGLPILFNTTLDSIPAPIPYLTADLRKAANWTERLKMQAGKLRVGIAWAGRTTHANDKNRSMNLGQWQPLLNVPGVSFVSLQKEIPECDIAAMATNNKILSLGSELNDFSDTAALIQVLDLVISVDTSVVHLAGALGKPAWVLLPYVPDWRWLYNREDSPWYPSLRLFRQNAPHDWRDPVERAAVELRKLAA